MQIDLQARFDQWVKLEDSRDKGLLKTEISSERHARPDLQTPYAAPRNETEQTITEQWQTLLGIDKIGIHDNFFDLGGNSLVAVQLISQMNEMFRIELTLDTIFNATTVAELAESINQLRGSVQDDSEKIAQKLALVEGLSDEKIRELLAEQGDLPEGE